MNTGQFYSKEIIINKSYEETYMLLLSIPEIKYFVIESRYLLFNQIIFQYDKINKIEVRIEPVSEYQTKLTLAVMDRYNSYFKSCDLASNVAANFEYALKLIVAGKPEAFKPESVSTGAAGCIQIILVAVLIILMVYCLLFIFDN